MFIDLFCELVVYVYFCQLSLYYRISVMKHCDYTVFEICLRYGSRGSTMWKDTYERRRAAVKLFPEHDNEVRVLALQNLKQINSDYVVRYFKTERMDESLMVFMEHRSGSVVNYLTFKKNPNTFKKFAHYDFSTESKRLIK